MSCTISSDSEWAFTGGKDCRVIAWRLSTKQAVCAVQLVDVPVSLGLLRNDAALLVAQANDVQVWTLDWELQDGDSTFCRSLPAFPRFTGRLSCASDGSSTPRPSSASGGKTDAFDFPPPLSPATSPCGDVASPRAFIASPGRVGTKRSTT